MRGNQHYKLLIGLVLLVVVGAAALDELKDKGTSKSAAVHSVAPTSAAPLKSAVQTATVPNPVQATSAWSTPAEIKVACVRRSYDHLIQAFTRVRGSSLSGEAERLASHRLLHGTLAGVDVSQCPGDYQTVHRQLVYNVGNALAVVHKANTSAGVSRSELDAATNAVGSSLDAIVEAAERYVPGSRRRASS